MVICVDALMRLCEKTNKQIDNESKTNNSTGMRSCKRSG